MSAYYNEIDKNAAAWLRELIKNGHIAEGIVDERSIKDVEPKDLDGFTQCHFFAGIGGWSYALRLAGWPDDRQVWTGSCPCQPFSTAGKGKGIDDERHLWPAFQWLIEQRNPTKIFGEQVEGKAGWSWFDIVSNDLEGIGYSCGAVGFPACGVGAPHKRQRLYWTADAKFVGQQKSRKHRENASDNKAEHKWKTDRLVNAVRWNSLPYVCSEHDGVSASLAKIAISGYGNAIVIPQAVEFISAAMEVFCDD